MSETNKFVIAVAKETGLAKSVVNQVLTGATDEVRRRLKAGEDVRVFGLGKFHIVYRKERQARARINQSADGKGYPMIVPAHKSVKFKPLPELIKAARGE